MKTLQQFGIWIVLGIVFIVWVFALCSFAGVLHAALPGIAIPRVATGAQVLVIFGVGLTITCGVLWIGDETKVIELKERTSLAIWTTLIAAILATSAAIYREHAGGRSGSLRIERLELLEVDASGNLPSPARIRATKVYDDPQDPVAFVAIVSGFDLDPSGKGDLEYRFYLEQGGNHIAHFADGTMPKAPAEFENRPSGVKFKDLFGGMTGKVSLSFTIASRENIGTGDFVLRAIVTDRRTSETVQATERLVFRPGANASPAYRVILEREIAVLEPGVSVQLLDVDSIEPELSTTLRDIKHAIERAHGVEPTATAEVARAIWKGITAELKLHEQQQAYELFDERDAAMDQRWMELLEREKSRRQQYGAQFIDEVDKTPFAIVLITENDARRFELVWPRRDTSILVGRKVYEVPVIANPRQRVVKGIYEAIALRPRA